MLYRNIKTGQIIDIASKAKGDWEAVTPSSQPADTVKKKEPVKKTTKKAR